MRPLIRRLDRRRNERTDVRGPSLQDRRHRRDRAVRRLPHRLARRLHPQCRQGRARRHAQGRGPADRPHANTYAPIALETGGKRVLIDTGNGEAMFAQSKGERGRLQQNLAAAGIDRDAIDLVVISHFHADHVNGLLTGRQQGGVSERRDQGAGGRVVVLDG